MKSISLSIRPAASRRKRDCSSNRPKCVSHMASGDSRRILSIDASHAQEIKIRSDEREGRELTAGQAHARGISAEEVRRPGPSSIQAWWCLACPVVSIAVNRSPPTSTDSPSATEWTLSAGEASSAQIPVECISEDAGRAVHQPRRVDKMASALRMDVDHRPCVGALTARTGMVKVNVGQEDMADVLELESVRLESVFETRKAFGRSAFDEDRSVRAHDQEHRHVFGQFPVTEIDGDDGAESGCFVGSVSHELLPVEAV